MEIFLVSGNDQLPGDGLFAEIEPVETDSGRKQVGRVCERMPSLLQEPAIDGSQFPAVGGQDKDGHGSR